MKNLLRFFYDQILSKNNLIKEMTVRIYYYSGYPIYIFNKIFKRPYIGSYLFSDQEAGRNRLELIRSILKYGSCVDSRINPKNRTRIFHGSVDFAEFFAATLFENCSGIICERRDYFKTGALDNGWFSRLKYPYGQAGASCALARRAPGLPSASGSLHCLR